MIVVLDSNVIVAAFVSRGMCHDVFRLAVERHEPVHSDLLLEEVKRILAGKIGAREESINAHLAVLLKASVQVMPAAVPLDACRDARDLHVLGAALAAGANLIVTGDQDLLVLGRYVGIRILSPAGAIAELDVHPPKSEPGGGTPVAAERGARYGRRTPRARRR